ncbi:sensor histidine kinase [Solihabitans fulvus]|uniref:histidine kinase n=1 Tax=Solihabitans fulvus TaxID=1892852 RepID=A0A5B2WVJ8_9PSEU|nr:sensor histidine kinase [Solihabitans fulvus]KAA2255993.1 sensor histidine kinase [Solihabitans fulvus]
MGTDRGWQWRGQDVALVAGVAALVLGNAALTVGAVVAYYYLVLAVSAVSLAGLRRAPRTVLGVTALAALVYFLGVRPDVTSAVPAMVAVFVLVKDGRRLIGGAAVVPVVLGALVFNLAATADQTVLTAVQGTFLLAGWFVAAVAAGEVARQRAAYLDQVEQRAAEALRTREEAAQRRAGEERLRIARELHDSLTHSISVIKVQAGVAVHLARKRGEDVPDALLAIQEASRDAMRELRTTLEVLRDTESEPAGSGLDRLDDLMALVRSTGLPAELTVSGERLELPAEVDRAAYRIIQEALTNIGRHAGPASASIRLAYETGALVVQVDDDGDAVLKLPPVPGIGLAGMRERVAALGGKLCVGPRPEGGFTVLAELPVGAHRD